MSRYLTILGVAIIVFSVAGGSLELSASYNEYQTRVRVSGNVTIAPLTVMDEAKWQVARIVGGAIIAGGVIAGSALLGLGSICGTLEQIRDLLGSEVVEISNGSTEAAKAGD
jgi:hypothetical protein